MSTLIVGLGNPGSKYENTRHNIGFMLLDRLASRVGVGFREKFSAAFAQASFAQQNIFLAKPLTYMNRSGISLGQILSFYKLPIQNCIVVHDDLDLPLGTVRVKVGGGHGGHNGLRSIFEHAGKDFVRVRLGVSHPQKGDVVDHVLGTFSSQEEAAVEYMLDEGMKAISAILEKGPKFAQNLINGGPEEKKPKKQRPKTKEGDASEAKPPSIKPPSKDL